uniref:WD repeat domain 74 n=1 Tax=Salmo trutta TaxID=8032 RepID=A0A673WIR9_SALTR
MAEKSQVCSVWVGSETGILKGVSLSKKQAFNFCEMSCLSLDQEVCFLGWGDQHETEVLVGSVNGTVKTFSTEKGIFAETRQCRESTQGRFTGLAVTDSALITCGDRTNGLKVWDLESPETPIFTSKNVHNNWLDLRMPDHHQVRVHDPASPQRRLVLEAHFGEYPLTALSLPANQDSVVVGNTHGELAILDLRKGLVRGCLKGLAGGVRELQVHSLEDRSLQQKVYLKSRFNYVFLSSKDVELSSSAVTGDVEEVKEEGGEVDEAWDTMEMIKDQAKKRATEEEEAIVTGVEKTTKKRKVVK